MRTRPLSGRHTIVAPVAGLPLVALLFAATPNASAQRSDYTRGERPTVVRATAFDTFIAEAAVRFGIPEH